LLLALFLVDAASPVVGKALWDRPVCVVPQISAVANVACGLEGAGVPLIADGGARYSGDIAEVITKTRATTSCSVSPGNPSSRSSA